MKIYLASPYSHENPAFMEMRYMAAVRAAGRLMQQGFTVYAPIAHSHAIGFEIGTATDHEFWMNQDLPMLVDCDALVVLDILGASSSRGVREEIQFAMDSHIPVIMLDPFLVGLHDDGSMRDEDAHPVLASYMHAFVQRVRTAVDPVPDMPDARAFETIKGPDPTKDTNPKDAIGATKIPLDLVPSTAIAVAALAHLDGACKYGRWNWRIAGVRASIYVAAAMRHIEAWNNGEDNDPDSGVSHLGHALACLNILIDAAACSKLTDDRAPAVGIKAWMSGLTPHVTRIQELHRDRDPYHYSIKDVA